MTQRSLVAALYLMVCGGPYGIEELCQTVGFGWAIAVLLITPILWSLPTALMVGELASALPREGGYYTWVRRGLGPFWGYQEAWLSLSASVFDMALYPTLFVLYLERLVPMVAGWPIAIGALVLLIAAVSNLAGAKTVGQESTAMSVALLLPFVVLAGIAFLSHHPHHPAAVPHLPAPGSAPAPDLAAGVLVAMWNYMGWDNASTIAGEVNDPQRSYPRAVMIAVALVALTYVVPVAAMWYGGVDPSTWDTGAWVTAGALYGGRTLATAIVCGGIISAFGMSMALCLSYSRLPAALAEDGYLPSLFAKRFPHNDVPWFSVLACSLAWALSLGISFDRLLSLDILLYGASLVLEFAALIALRLREPELARPMRVPGGIGAVLLLALGPAGLVLFALSKSSHETIGRVNSLLFGSVVILLGPLTYATLRLCGRGRIQPTKVGVGSP